MTYKVPDSGALLAWGNSSISAGADTRFLDCWYNQATAPTTQVGDIVITRPGILRNLFVRHSSALGNGNSVVYTLFKNGITTLLDLTLATGAIGQNSNLVTEVGVIAGDRVILRALKALAIGNGSVEAKGTIGFFEA